MKKIRGLSIQKLILAMTAVASALVFLVLFIITNVTIGKLKDQQMGQRWSIDGGAAQVSVFFKNGIYQEADDLGYVEYQIKQALMQESIEVDPETPNARLLTSCYCANGKISVNSEYGKADLTAIGVGGDFFMFHEMDYISGTYFSDDDINSDYCILDESAAWKLFGSSDVAGQTIFANQTPLIVKGVIKLPENELYKNAGLKQDFCFINYDYLKANGSCDSVASYEIVMPNPVPGYALEKVKKSIGVDEKDIVLVDNTARFGFIQRLKNLSNLKYRSMVVSFIAFPYWENVARYTLDNCSVLTLIYLIFIIYTILMLLALLIILIIQNRLLIYELIRKLVEFITGIIRSRLKGRKNYD